MVIAQRVDALVASSPSVKPLLEGIHPRINLQRAIAVAAMRPGAWRASRRHVRIDGAAHPARGATTNTGVLLVALLTVLLPASHEPPEAQARCDEDAAHNADDDTYNTPRSQATAAGAGILTLALIRPSRLGGDGDGANGTTVSRRDCLDLRRFRRLLGFRRRLFGTLREHVVSIRFDSAG